MRRAASSLTNMEPRKQIKLLPWDECPKSHMAFKFSYLGFNYDGVASQLNTKNTVEECLFRALLRTKLIDDRKTSNYSLCGRTDKGVSALANVFSITLRSRLPHNTEEFNYPKILNSQLPGDIRITHFSRVPHHFDARFSCIYREYRYNFLVSGKSLPLMAEACKMFEGVHDFRNFCKEDPEKKRSMQRRVLSCTVEQFGDFGVITVLGYSFLWHQVRCMVSIIFKIGEGKESLDLVQKMLEHTGAKPQYNIASELGLVLFDCGFETVEFEKVQDEDLAMPLKGIEDDLKLRLQVVQMLTPGQSEIVPEVGKRKENKKIKLKPS